MSNKFRRFRLKTGVVSGKNQVKMSAENVGMLRNFFFKIEKLENFYKEFLLSQNSVLKIFLHENLTVAFATVAKVWIRPWRIGK
jgi:hypothetical protein